MKDVFTFGAHRGNHFSFPYREEIVDFFDGSNFHWTLLLYSDKPFIGLPRFPMRSELDIRKFYPSEDVLEFCSKFPKKGKWKEKLRQEISRQFKTFGRFETKEDAKRRIEKELKESKKKIEEHLGITVDNFSWPFGHYSDFSKKVAEDFYSYIFTIKKGFIGKGSDYAELPRISIGKDLFTLLGRIFTFSTNLGFTIYRKFKKGKML